MIDHIAIQVESIEKSVRWYTDRFGCRVLYSDDTWAMLDMDNVKLALTIPSQHPPHIAITVKSLSDFPRGKEIKTHRDGSMFVYQPDESGNVVEYIYYPES